MIPTDPTREPSRPLGGGVAGLVERFDVLLPAGGHISGELAKRTGVENKALIEFGGQTLARRTVDAIRATPGVGRIAVAGDLAVTEHLGDAVDASGLRGGTAPGTLVNALKALGDPTRKVLIVTTDLPYLTPESLTAFLTTCRSDRDLNVPIIERTRYQTRFPGSTSTYIPLKDGAWTAGCAYLLDSEAFLRIVPQLDRLFDVRKSKLGMARLLGPAFLLKFLTKTLTVADVEGKIRSMLGVTGAAIPDGPPELAFDIDDLDDYEYALAHPA